MPLFKYTPYTTAGPDGTSLRFRAGDSGAQELAEFGINTLIIEPGSIKTGFVANIRWTEQLEAYKGSAVGNLRGWIEQHGEDTASGDPLKMADAIYTLSQLHKPPLRTVLGGDAYAALEAGYARSLADIQAQKALAESVMLEGKAGFRPE